ncbi:MAG: COG4223 family protein [Alphaproteobacteria bacterium]
MSNSGKKSITDAVKIIEKFGGIRPMSAKVNVAVTTIQGWKKRDTIPVNRKSLLLRCAAEHNIDLSEFFEDAPRVVTESAVEEQGVEVDTEVDVEDGSVDSGDVEDQGGDMEEKENIIHVKADEFRGQPRASTPHKDFTEIAVTTERRAITKSSLIAAGMVVLVVGAIAATLWPEYEEYDTRGMRLSDLESEVSDIKQKQTTFKGLVPEDWSEQLENLKTQMRGAKEAVGDTVHVVKEFSSDLTTGEGLEQRVVQLQGYVAEMASGNGISALMGRYDSMRESVDGQATLDNSVSALMGVFGGGKAEGKSDAEVNASLEKARAENGALAQTFGNVPKTELKAAAMLFALTQVRSALNRQDKDFDGDLQLLMNMVDENDVELRGSLEKIAPHSKSGLLSGYGLKEELQTVAGDVVAASLSGEDVSFSEKMSAKMNDILQVEKDGELVSGSDAQKTVDQAQKLIERDRLAEALKLLKSHLNDKELAPLRPWLKRAEAVLTSQSVKQAIERAIELNTGKGYLGGEAVLKDSRD